MGVEDCRDEDGRVTIDGSRCERCGLVAFPAERYGCERCGAPPADHRRERVATDGVVIARATVHRHHHPEPATPFVVVEVLLDGGPALKALHAGTGPVHIGDRVTGTLLGERFAFRAAAVTP